MVAVSLTGFWINKTSIFISHPFFIEWKSNQISEPFAGMRILVGEQPVKAGVFLKLREYAGIPQQLKSNVTAPPGGGNPNVSTEYDEVYSVITREAKKRGFNTVFSSLRWPVHTSIDDYTSSTYMNFQSPVGVALTKIKSLPEEPTLTLARSYRCHIALKVATIELIKESPIFHVCCMYKFK